MSKQRIALMAFGVIYVLDLIAILIGASKPDLYLRPLVLLAILLMGFFSLQGKFGISQVFILIAVLIAIPLEYFQGLGAQFGWIIVATFIGYAFYTLGFAFSGLAKYSWKIVIPFLGLGVYMLVSFWLLNPYMFRFEASIYMAVTAIMLSFALYPVISGNKTNVARYLAAGALLLLVSDSLRAVVQFKLQASKDNFMEALIVALFFLGHFFIVRSLQRD